MPEGKRRRLSTGTVAAGLLIVLVAGAIWIVWTGARAVADLEAAQRELRAAQRAINELDLASAQTSTLAAQEATRAAADHVHDPVWFGWSLVPWLGDTADAVRQTTDALVVAAGATTSLIDAASGLDPDTLREGDRIRVEQIAAANEPLTVATAELEESLRMLRAAQSSADGAFVPGMVDDAVRRVTVQVAEVLEATATSRDVTEALPAMLGADGRRNWFVGLQTPAETRGTGGLVGTWVLISANDGRLAVQQSGSNSDMPELDSVPIDDPDYIQRYGQDVRLFQNSNASPHFPYAAQLWSEFWRARGIGAPIDGALATDPIALGYLLRATGPITLPDGRRLNASNTADFALKEMYEIYPDRKERKAYQELVAEEIFSQLTQGDVDVQALLRAMNRIVSEGRLLAWSRVDAEQSLLADSTLGGVVDLPDPAPLDVYPVVINTDGSKLNAYLEREMSQEVVGCPTEGRVAAKAEVVLTQQIDDPEDLDKFIVAQARTGPDGIESRVHLQIHLGEHTQVTGVTVDGEPAQHTPFTERGRASVLLPLTLSSDGTPVRVVVTSTEIADPRAEDLATVTEQPLVDDPVVAVDQPDCG